MRRSRQPRACARDRSAAAARRRCAPNARTVPLARARQARATAPQRKGVNVRRSFKPSRPLARGAHATPPPQSPHRADAHARRRGRPARAGTWWLSIPLTTSAENTILYQATRDGGDRGSRASRGDGGGGSARERGRFLAKMPKTEFRCCVALWPRAASSERKEQPQPPLLPPPPPQPQ